MGAAPREEGARENYTSRRRRSPPASQAAGTSHEPRLSSRVRSLTQHFRGGQNPAAQGGRCRTCPHLSPAKDTTLQFPPRSPPSTSNHGHLHPLPSPGVPFPERGFEQRRDVRPLDVQIRRSAFRHLLPLAVAETAATAAARPRALWEWRPAAPPSRQVETKRGTGGGAPLDGTWPWGRRRALPWSAALHRPPLVQHLASASCPGDPLVLTLRAGALVRSRCSGVTAPSARDFCLLLPLCHRRLETLVCAFTRARGTGKGGDGRRGDG